MFPPEQDLYRARAAGLSARLLHLRRDFSLRLLISPPSRAHLAQRGDDARDRRVAKLRVDGEAQHFARRALAFAEYGGPDRHPTAIGRRHMNRHGVVDVAADAALRQRLAPAVAPRRADDVLV